ncbi:MAG TPA: tetratricopeptide repeat protein [Woeseiaceae bacterium]|nr:tetratricopeptide repeat protein [Woeseiaceae bacterium]
MLALAPVLPLFAGCASAPPAEYGTALDTEREIPPEIRTQFEQAVSIMAAGDLTEAEPRLEEFALQYPAYPGAHVNLAILHAAEKDDAAAEASIAKALELDPVHPAALNQLGMLRRRQGRFEDAEAAYLKAVTADPEYALAHFNLGVLYELYLQRLESALQHFERYQALSGEDEQVAKWIVDLRRRVAASQRTADTREP